ncbi:ArsR family transcriptional regulator [Methanotrichaceae archaeon M04Ac]|uniref:ArsR family transcriptional regulator n=1 Tax=Candidatus Methanocrinis alkalitolerans TaxID=3033395 RepID=A0ABT5XEK9_9EURY|nr:ArsR family transcriptional regulator [Candidatus Methanocrinis alkalitolerans]MCR3884043.1 ArsR family transcriptional regulator [Methanothrix sp.]MDF0593095.1 ArsR family transcriptional regulator [Candidatus Methanocrinis alkalitolerans]
MGKRTRIINDPSDLVPLLLAFGSEVHKRVFEELCSDWRTEKDLVGLLGDERGVQRSLVLLKKSGLIETKWKMPKPGESPEKEYHSSYSRVQANFVCSLEDLSELIYLTSMSDDEIREGTERIEELVAKGNTSLSNLSRELDLSQAFIRGSAKRAERLAVRGQRIELSREEG